MFPRYSPDGRLLAFSRQMIKGFYADRVRLMLFERRTEQERNLTEKWDRSVDGLVWSPDSDSLFGSIDDGGTRRIYRFDVSGGEPKAITRDSSFSSLAIAGSGPVIVGLRQSFIEPPTLVSIIPRTGAATKLSDFNDAALAKLTQGRYESVTFLGANGEPVQMWIVYPPNFTPDRKWPLYLLLHGGPHNAATDGYQWRWNAQVFANWGYVTAWHNFHGSSGFGQAWTDSITREWGELPYQDTIKAAEWFAAKPWIDADRMAAGGGSYGGYLASLLLGKPHPFKTLVAHAAVYDSYTQYASDYGAAKKRFGEYWEDFERFHRNSPHMNAGELQHTDARDSRTTRFARPGESRTRALQHAAEPRRAEQVRVLPGRESLDSEAAELALLVRDEAQVAGAVRETGSGGCGDAAVRRRSSRERTQKECA